MKRLLLLLLLANVAPALWGNDEDWRVLAELEDGRLLADRQTGTVWRVTDASGDDSVQVIDIGKLEKPAPEVAPLSVDGPQAEAEPSVGTGSAGPASRTAVAWKGTIALWNWLSERFHPFVLVVLAIIGVGLQVYLILAKADSLKAQLAATVYEVMKAIKTNEPERTKERVKLMQIELKKARWFLSRQQWQLVRAVTTEAEQLGEYDLTSEDGLSRYFDAGFWGQVSRGRVVENLQKLFDSLTRTGSCGSTPEPVEKV